MCVCVYICIHIYTLIYIYICIHPHTYTHICKYITHTHIHIYVNISATTRNFESFKKRWSKDVYKPTRTKAHTIEQRLELKAVLQCTTVYCVAICCSVLQCVAVCCSVLQCVAVVKNYWRRIDLGSAAKLQGSWSRRDV